MGEFVTSKDLLNSIISKIEKLGIELKTGNLVGAVAYISPKAGWGVWDSNKASIFDLCHEYIHAKYGDTTRCSDNDCNNPCEKRANCESILMLWDIYKINGGEYKEFAHFIELTDCPYDLAHNLISKKRAVITDRKEIYSKLKSYILNTDEEPEDWNVYRIMEECCIDIAENYYAMQVLLEISHELLGVF